MVTNVKPINIICYKYLHDKHTCNQYTIKYRAITGNNFTPVKRVVVTLFILCNCVIIIVVIFIITTIII